MRSLAGATVLASRGERSPALVRCLRKPKPRASRFLQDVRGADREVVAGRHGRHLVRAFDAPVVAHLDADAVAKIDRREDALQQVVAVRQPADDVQEEIELRRRRIPG